MTTAGGTATIFPEGDVLEPTHANFLFDENVERVGPGTMTPVDHYPVNRFGISDMIVNGSEGTSTRGKRPGTYLLCGGAWDYMPRLLRWSSRDELEETAARDSIGFRIAFT